MLAGYRAQDAPPKPAQRRSWPGMEHDGADDPSLGDPGSAMSLAGSLLRAGVRGATLPLSAAGAAVDAGLAVERQARAAAVQAGERLALGALDAALAGETIDRIFEHVEASGAAEHIARRVLEDGIAEQVLARVLQGPEIERMLADALDSERTRQQLVRALESEGTERLVDGVLASPASERILAQVLQSPLLRETVTRLLESEELWILVDEIARSPPVTEAITHQSAGFIDQVTDRVRDSSRDADAWVERRPADRRDGRRQSARAVGRPALPVRDSASRVADAVSRLSDHALGRSPPLPAGPAPGHGGGAHPRSRRDPVAERAPARRGLSGLSRRAGPPPSHASPAARSAAVGCARRGAARGPARLRPSR